MQFDLVTPEMLIVSSETVTYVNAPGEEGNFGVLDGHSSFISMLKPGMLEVEDNGKKLVYAIGYGYADVTPEKVIVLAEEAMLKDDINLAETKKELQDVTDRLTNLVKSNGDNGEIEFLSKQQACLQAKIDVIELS